MRNPDCDGRGSLPVGALEYVRNWQRQGTPNLRPLPSECKKTLFHHLVMLSNRLKYNRCYCITEDGFAYLGTLFCPKIVPKRDLCLPGSRLRGRPYYLPASNLSVAFSEEFCFQVDPTASQFSTGWQPGAGAEVSRWTDGIDAPPTDASVWGLLGGEAHIRNLLIVDAMSRILWLMRVGVFANKWLSRVLSRKSRVVRL